MKGGFGLGLIFSSLIKGLFKLFDMLFMLIASILLYFGLWIVAAYMLYVLCLCVWCDLNLSIAGVERNLFFFGLALACLCSVIITARNLILKPFKEYSEAKRIKSEYRRRKMLSDKKSLYRKNPKKYYAKYRDPLPPVGATAYSDETDMRKESHPLIYRSHRNPEIIVHEFQDRYEVFREENGEIFHIDTKQKPKKQKRR